MKRHIKIITLIILTFFICSCSSKKEYNLIELSSSEFVSNILESKEKNIVFAFCDSSTDKYNQFLKDLKNVSQSAKLDIYYLDINHFDSGSYLIISSIDAISTTANSYYAYINGELVVSELYTDFKTMYKSLKSIGYKSEIEKQPKEEKLKKIDEAKELYQAGHISKAMETLNYVWDLEEAKKEFKENKYYNILNSWERYEVIDDKMEKIYYENLIFYYNSDTYDYASVTQEYNKDFTKPSSYDDYKDIYYYIKDDIIYTSNTASGKYKEKYKITYIDSKNLYLLDFKKNEEYQYILR